MRTKRVSIIILTVFLLRVIISCCDCPKLNEHKYSYDNLSVYNLDNSGQNPVISLTNIVPSKAYGIEIDFSLIRVALNRSKTLTVFPEAFAQDCFCLDSLQYIAKDTITSIDITTIDDFDSQRPANSDVSYLFKILQNNSYVTFQEYINQPEIIYQNKIPEKEILQLFLLQPPQFLGEHKFKIGITLSDNRLLTTTTNPVILQ